MPSPAERIAVERLLRGAGFVALGVAIWLAFFMRDVGRRPVDVTFTESPSPAWRDSLAALRHAGRTVVWRGGLSPAIAMAEPTSEPNERWRVAVVAETAMVASDSLGPMDSLPAIGTLHTEPTRGVVQLRGAASRLTSMPRERALVSRALVLGRAGWEARFIIAALEESGWSVDALLTLGRGRDVSQGLPLVSIARHSVAVVLDSASLAREAEALARFVRAGGGVVLVGEAARAEAPAMRALVGARVTRLAPPEVSSFSGHEATHALPLQVLGERVADAVVVESREALPAIVARRVGAGRVIQVGYEETWRWRMQGEGRAVEDHRAFWSRTAAQAARATYVRREMPPLTVLDEAPAASVLHALGPAATSPLEIPTPRKLPLWLAPVILVLFVAEWASRRSRGAP